MNNSQLGKTAGQSIEYFACFVFAAVVDGDDLKVRVSQFHQGFDRIFGMGFFVEAWHQHGDQWVVVTFRWLIDDAVRIALKTQIKTDAADHPDHRHQDRIEEDEGEHRTPAVTKQGGQGDHRS